MKTSTYLDVMTSVYNPLLGQYESNLAEGVYAMQIVLLAKQRLISHPKLAASNANATLLE